MWLSLCNSVNIYIYTRQPRSSRSIHDVSKFTGTLTSSPTPKPLKNKKKGFVTSCLGAALGTNIAIENGHLWLIYLVKMVIFHSYVVMLVYQKVFGVLPCSLIYCSILLSGGWSIYHYVAMYLCIDRSIRHPFVYSSICLSIDVCMMCNVM